MSAPAPSPLDGIGQVVDRYDAFLIDQFGVLHEGTRPYTGAVETLARLKAAGKKVLLLSNSGKRSASNEDRLVRLGFERKSWDHFLSSGEVAWGLLQEDLQEGVMLRCLLITRDDDGSAIEGLPLTVTGSGEDAEIILLSGSEGDRYDIEHYRDLLLPAAARNVRCICTNPDKIMLTPAGPRFGAGRIAELYEDLGGTVTWIGKPFPHIYRAALERLGNPAPTRVLCIGDSIEHDIAGGRQAGLDTALVATGILETMPAAERELLFKHHGATPDFLLPAFHW